MVAPKTVLRKNVINNKKINAVHDNMSNNFDTILDTDLNAHINKYFETNESVSLSSFESSFNVAATTTTTTTTNSTTDDFDSNTITTLNNDANNIILDTLETTRNHSFLDFIPTSAANTEKKYISSNTEELINFNDDDNEANDLLSIATNSTRNHLNINDINSNNNSYSVSSGSSDSNTIIDSLLGSIMTTATAPVTTITPTSMAQLVTSTYFHMINQDDNHINTQLNSHYQHLLEHRHHHNQQQLNNINTATIVATESPLSLLLTSSTSTSTAAASAATTLTMTDSLVSSSSASYNDTLTVFWAADSDYLYRHSMSMTVVYCVAYIFVFLVGLIGNSFVIAVVLRAPRMRTVTNYFIVNLAIADILVIVFCLPATLMSNIFVPWMLGWLMCKTVPYIQGVSVAASVYSLIAVSLDRFIAIWWPLKQMTKSRARFMILCIWIIALGSTIPWILFFDLVPASDAFPAGPDMYLCQEVWPPGTNGNLYFLLAHLVACYLLPMSLITLCYVLIWIKVSTRTIPGESKDAQMDRMQQKSKVKVIKMLVAVVILFVVSWMPLYAIFARIKFGGEITPEESEILNKVTPIAQWLGASNSCINPILYAFFNKKYRRGFAAIIKSRSCCGRLRYYDNVAIASSTTSTRKSSHYHSSRKSPNNAGLRKTNAVSYIYEHNTLRRQNLMMKQDSNLSQQMLLKQDSHGSRQYLIKQESASSDGSRRLLCQQDSNGSKMSLSKQDSVVSYVEAKRNAYLNNIERNGQDTFSAQDSVSIDSRRGTIVSPNTNLLLEHKRQKFVKQDSVISFADQRPEPRRHQLVKQDSVISFADQRKILSKQDSIIACPNKTGDGTGHHVSILKKTDSQLCNGFSSPRRNIEIYE